MEALSPLSHWESFYVIVGSSGAALTGLQFVVMALIADTRPSSTGSEDRGVRHAHRRPFSFVLLVAAILSAPWPTLSGAALTIGACGLAGVAYTMVVIRRARRQTAYKPVLEDWMWHVVFPLVAYAATLAAAVLLTCLPTEALFSVAGGAMLLLFVGIHNSWDTVTFIVIDRPKRGEPPSED